jgi:hypothetical protein
MAGPEKVAVIARMMSVLTACVCEQFTKLGRPLCTCCLRHAGDLVPMDGCGECDCSGGTTGNLFARVVSIDPGDDTSGPCTSQLLAVSMDFAVFRCVETTPDGTMPTCDVVSSEALEFLLDEQILRRAVACCNVADLVPGGWQITPGTWTPSGPSGICAGGVLRVVALGVNPLNNFIPGMPMPHPWETAS